MSITHNNQGPPHAGPPPPNNNGPPLVVRPNGPAPRSIEELCQPSIHGRGGPIAPIPIQATDFGLRHHMIKYVKNTCQFHGLSGDDANRHIENFLEVTQHMKQNGVSDDALHLSLFLYSLTHHATACNSVANPRGDLKDITTRNGAAYDGPTIPPTPSSLLKEVERKTEKISLPELTPTCMTLELVNRSVAYPVVDYDVDPRVPLILGRPFMRTARALIDVHGEELTRRVNDEAITFKVGHTSRYSRNYYEESVNQVNIIDVACEEYAQELLGFLDRSTSGNPTPSDPIIAYSSLSFTPFRGSDFILEEIETFLHPSLNLPPMKNEDLKQDDVTITKPLTEEPLKLKLKDLLVFGERITRKGQNRNKTGPNQEKTGSVAKPERVKRSLSQ
nr:reverse transcriptase domain-containing protein [Tanacetum cinerariifolium]